MWLLGPYRLDPTSFSLERAGEPVPLQRRPFDLLLFLVSHPGRVVSHDELLREVWGGVAVVRGAVSTAVYELRSALGDLERSPAERWIETVRGRGFRFRGPVTPVETAAPPTDGIPFVGRGRLLQTLGERVEAARRGRGGALVVEGRAGMGKTRLVQELTASLGGLAVHTVQCEPGAPPLWPWEQLRRALGAGSAAAPPIEPGDATGEGDGHALHFERVDAVARLLAEAAGREPLLVIVEDLHWADPSSFAVFESLAPRLAAMRVQVVATERSEIEGEPDADVPASHVSRLRLGPLRTTELYPLVEAVSRRMPSPELVGWIQRHSQGVPLMVRELAERVALEGESLVDVPRIAQRVFSHRFERLDEASRLAMGIAALCGLRFDAPLVEAAAGDALPADRAWIRQGLGAGILVPVSGHPLRFAFRHALLREAAEGLLDPLQVPGWHRRIAAAIESQRPEPAGAVLSQLARHSAAGAVEDPDVREPLRYALLAARRAAGVLDWAEVAVHANHVLTWIEFLPPSDERDAQEIEAALLRCAAIAFSTGHVEESESLLERIEPLLARHGPDAMRGVAEAFRFANARCMGDYARAREAADLVAERLGLDEVAACWRLSLAVVTGDFRSATDDPEWGDALPLDPRFHDFARRCGRDPGIDRLGLAAFAFHARGDDARAVARAERAVAWAGESGDARGRIWGLFLLCMLHEMRRDWAELRRLAPEIDQATARSGVSAWLGVGAGLRLWAEAREKGAPGPALRPLADVLVDRARSTSTSLTSPLLLLSSRIFTWCEDLEAGERVAREGIAWAERTGEQMVLAELHRQLGQVLLRRGEGDAAGRSFQQGVEVARRQGHRASELRGLRDLAGQGRADPDQIARLHELEERVGAAARAPRVG